METGVNKTKEKLDLWCSAPGIAFASPQAEQDYRERSRRISDAIQLAIPDRVPITPLVTFFPSQYAGMTMRVMYNPDKASLPSRKWLWTFNGTAMNLGTLVATCWKRWTINGLNGPGTAATAPTSSWKLNT
jgi:hypothetical protein